MEFYRLNLVLNYTKIADIPKKGNRAFWLHAALARARSSSLERFFEPKSTPGKNPGCPAGARHCVPFRGGVNFPKI